MLMVNGGAKLDTGLSRGGELFVTQPQPRGDRPSVTPVSGSATAAFLVLATRFSAAVVSANV